ncbi:MAG: DNA polymerase III subunit delta' [Zetaproteobacteria bacterium]|nr:MAG: DNA polymerase III subunit delta' [Zetaproteobacteria bacterium]
MPTAWEIVGHTAVRDTLCNGLGAREGGHHAWLLYGPSGIGKALLAREAASAFLCRGAAPPCGACHSCRLVHAGTHPDLRLLQRPEGKRDLPVEAVREALAFLSLTGHESSRRVLIIDDAETMNRSAANALLKGLEEPQEGAAILLVCGEPNRLPATIRSRCLLQPCHALGEEECRQVLQRMGIAEAALPLALRLARGRPGRVALLRDEGWCRSLQQWERLLEDLPRCDLAEARRLSGGKWNAAALQLVVELAVEAACRRISRLDFARGEALLDGCRRLAELPRRAERQTLRADLALFGAVVELRRLSAGR